MTRRYRWLALFVSVLLLLGVLSGCSASKAAAEVYQSSDSALALTDKKEVTEEDILSVEAPEEAPDTPFADGSTTINTTSGTSSVDNGSAEAAMLQNYAEKIIYSGHVYLETTAFDDALLQLDKTVTAMGGFIQDSSINGYTRRNQDGTTTVVDRWGHYVVRVPSSCFGEFMQKTEGIGNVTSSSRSAENVTSRYTDYEARLSSLTIQEERLLSMLKESGDLESLIQLEARLSEVRYEIEAIQRNLRDLDRRLSFSTITLELQEVEIYTPTVPVKRTFGEKLSTALHDGWSGFVRGLQDFVVGLAYALPTLLLIAAIVVSAVFIFRHMIRKWKSSRKRRKEKRTGKATTSAEEDSDNTKP